MKFKVGDKVYDRINNITGHIVKVVPSARYPIRALFYDPGMETYCAYAYLESQLEFVESADVKDTTRKFKVGDKIYCGAYTLDGWVTKITPSAEYPVEAHFYDLETGKLIKQNFLESELEPWDLIRGATQPVQSATAPSASSKSEPGTYYVTRFDFDSETLRLQNEINELKRVVAELSKK
jgi:hypothetical protein